MAVDTIGAARMAKVDALIDGTARQSKSLRTLWLLTVTPATVGPTSRVGGALSPAGRSALVGFRSLSGR